MSPNPSSFCIIPNITALFQRIKELFMKVIALLLTLAVFAILFSNSRSHRKGKIPANSEMPLVESPG